MLGQRRIKGWWMLVNPRQNHVYYQEPIIRKVNVRGNLDRYIAYEVVGWSYQNPTSGSSGTTSTFGTSRTNCTGYGNSIDCTTTPARTISRGGSPGNPGGVKRYSFTYVLDCQERTYAAHQGNKVMGGWKKIRSGTQDERKVNKFCPVITTLELSTFRKYAK